MRRGLTAAATVGFAVFGAGGALAVPSQAHPVETTGTVQCRLLTRGATTYRVTLPKGNVGCGAATKVLARRRSGEGLLQGQPSRRAAERYGWPCGYETSAGGCIRRGQNPVDAPGDVRRRRGRRPRAPCDANAPAPADHWAGRASDTRSSRSSVGSEGCSTSAGRGSCATNASHARESAAACPGTRATSSSVGALTSGTPGPARR